MTEILFVAVFPEDKNIKDGMIRRIKEIDKKFEEVRRTYLEINFFSNPKIKYEEKENLEIHRLNFFIDYFKIKKILKSSKKIYLHSIVNYVRILLFPFVSGEIILDVHGAGVEEMKFYNKNIKSFILKFIEKKLFKRLNKAIFVSNQMKRFYINKYPFIKNKKLLVYPIMNFDRINIKIREKEEKETVFIYSGNLQKWQNIDLMLEKIKEIENDNYKYIFLTNETEELKRKIEKIGLINYMVDSVLPEELGKFYEIAHYGFILRDEHILNKVANPTKLGEYMEYGIIPIVKYDEIGDYKDYGYEYLSIENLSKNLLPKKSLKNQKIIKDIKNMAESINYKDFILED